MSAHHALGLTLNYSGAFAQAQIHLEEGSFLYNPQQHAPPQPTYGMLQNYGVSCRSLSASVLFILGYPNQALRRIHDALTLAQEQTHPYSLSVALHDATILYQRYREVQAVHEQAQTLIALATEHGFSHWLALGTFNRGWALTMQGQGEEGIAQMRQGLASYRTLGMEVGVTICLSVLAESYAAVE